VNFPEIGRSFFGDTEGPAREALGDAGFAEAWAIGRAMDTVQIAELLTSTGPD
jgi:hypothetical protein